MNLYPKTKHPYYIVCPRYMRTSAGIRALYLLCHHLNLNGYPAYIILWPWRDLEFCDEMNSDLLTPLLTKIILERHLNNATHPITLYTETVPGNPFHAPCVARFYGNFPELLGGGAVSNNELNFGYSKVLAEAIGSPENIIFIPTIDTNVFFPSNSNVERRGTCYYAAKYKEIHHAKTFDVTSNSIEITRETHIWTPSKIAQMFRTSELFYVYENTMLATEAILCGCPTVMLPNPYMTACISSAEFGDFGLAWGNTPSQIQHAKESVHKGWETYKESLNIFNGHLSLFIKKTQGHAETIYGP